MMAMLNRAKRQATQRLNSLPIPFRLRMFQANSRKAAITFRCFLMIPQLGKRKTSLLRRTPIRLANRKTTSLLKAERIPPHSLLI